ncbi:MAG: SPFH domain-containing protein [Clostridiales bacterium]|nr:SPFH domain-containing protein [Clostridiales bacterium]MDU3241770.1 SPFH domain-containing protein [Clostridiales bacterium]
MEINKQKITEEKDLKAANGMGMLFLCIIGLLGSVVLFIVGVSVFEGALSGVVVTLSIIIFTVACIGFGGLKVINPNEALVLALFGNYYGTLKNDGYFWVNPFCSAINPTVKRYVTASAGNGANVNIGGDGSKKVSLKTLTLNNEKQKVNDELGNPIEIGTVVIWKVENATKAVLNVENYKKYLSIQCDAITRNAARRYPYDTSEGGDERSLRGSSQEVADIMKGELQEKVADAGINIMEVRITHLSYAPEIASAMLQRQQAAAIIDARQKIVEGAVSMVEMALQKLSENEIVELDEERKAAMVSNLLVVLCGNKDAQPIVNSGSLY